MGVQLESLKNTPSWPTNRKYVLIDQTASPLVKTHCHIFQCTQPPSWVHGVTACESR